MVKKIEFDEIGYWSEVKLEIIRRYAKEYSTILSKQPSLRHYYVDAFSGAGRHRRKGTGESVEGSPLVALGISPPFSGYWFIDLDAQKIEFLRKLIGDRKNVEVRTGDCNTVLHAEVFPSLSYESRARALCLIDPYGLHLDWSVLEEAGRAGTVEIFLNFPVADMNRNVFWKNPDGVDPQDIERMNRFWGNNSWRDTVYSRSGNLFGDEEKVSDNADVAAAFQKRLREVAGFKYVPNPLPMRNSQGAIVYYLFFASPNPTADKIVRHIFDMFRDTGRVT
jgi:three-Cys-motif partner protein